MVIIIGVALVLLGLAAGLIIGWAIDAGASVTLAIGLLLAAAGAVVGFITEWLIDEAYRKNRELRRLLGERGEQGGAVLAVGASASAQGDAVTSETLAGFLRQRDQELHELREQVTASEARLDDLRGEFADYQRTHPDDLTVIKGVGPVYQWKLRDAGFNTYQQLAAADPDQLRRMLDVRNWQRVNVESWIEQARDWAQRG